MQKSTFLINSKLILLLKICMIHRTYLAAFKKEEKKLQTANLYWKVSYLVALCYLTILSQVMWCRRIPNSRHSAEAENRKVEHYTWHTCEPWTLKVPRLPTTAN